MGGVVEHIMAALDAMMADAIEEIIDQLGPVFVELDDAAVPFLDALIARLTAERDSMAAEDAQDAVTEGGE